MEVVFGPGATLLAKELENNSDKKEEIITSDTEQNSDNEIEHMDASTLAKDQRKKRVRKNIKCGDLSSIEGVLDNQSASSEEEHSEEVKKPRLRESSETHEDNNIGIVEKENIIAGDITKNSEELSEGKMGDEDHTEGLKEEDKIMQALLNMHEEVPIGDPGPNIEDKGEGDAGATQ